MSDLDQILGALMVSLAHARRIADEETTAIAEYYKDNPLLEGMSVPRIRVPEMVLDVPLVIESHSPGSANVPESPDNIVHAIAEEFGDAARREGLVLDDAVIERFSSSLRREIARVAPSGSAEASRYPREVAERGAERAMMSALKQSGAREVSADQIKKIGGDLRKRARDVAIKQAGERPVISASINTAEVKEHAAAANVTRLRLVLKEEGLEWSVVENDDGSRDKKLTPE